MSVRLLDVGKEVAFEDVLALLVPLGRLVRSVVFPAQRRATLDAVDIADSMVSGRHLAICWFTFDHVDYNVEQVGSSVLTVECPRDHGMDRGEVGPAARAPIDAGALQVLAVAHTHGGEDRECVGRVSGSASGGKRRKAETKPIKAYIVRVASRRER